MTAWDVRHGGYSTVASSLSDHSESIVVRCCTCFRRLFLLASVVALVVVSYEIFDYYIASRYGYPQEYLYDDTRKVICEYDPWEAKVFTKSRFNVKDVPLDVCDIVAYSAMGFKGNIMKPVVAFKSRSAVDYGPNGFKALIQRRLEYPTLKVILVMFGEDQQFSDLAGVLATDENIHLFVKNLVDFINTHNFDGVMYDFRRIRRMIKLIRRTVTGTVVGDAQSKVVADISNFDLLLYSTYMRLKAIDKLAIIGYETSDHTLSTQFFSVSTAFRQGVGSFIYLASNAVQMQPSGFCMSVWGKASDRGNVLAGLYHGECKARGENCRRFGGKLGISVDLRTTVYRIPERAKKGIMRKVNVSFVRDAFYAEFCKVLEDSPAAYVKSAWSECQYVTKGSSLYTVISPKWGTSLLRLHPDISIVYIKGMFYDDYMGACETAGVRVTPFPLLRDVVARLHGKKVTTGADVKSASVVIDPEESARSIVMH